MARAHLIALAGASNVAKKPSPSRVDLAASEAPQQGSDDLVVTPEQIHPFSVAKLASTFRRSDDVREHDGGEHAVQRRLLVSS